MNYFVTAWMFLCLIFNTDFDIGWFPDTWTAEFIVPLHKKGLDDGAG